MLLVHTDPVVLEVRRVVEGARGPAPVQVGVVGAVHHLGAAHRHAAGRPRARPMPPRRAPPLLRTRPRQPEPRTRELLIYYSH